MAKGPEREGEVGEAERVERWEKVEEREWVCVGESGGDVVGEEVTGERRRLNEFSEMQHLANR